MTAHRTPDAEQRETTAGYDALFEAATQRISEAIAEDTELVLVNTATCARSVGALEVLDAVKAVTRDGERVVIETGCLGHCYAEPTLCIGTIADGFKVYGYVDAVAARFIVADAKTGSLLSDPYLIGRLDADGSVVSEELAPRVAHERRLILRNCGVIDPLDIDQYVAAGGYRALAHALSMEGAEVIDALERARLRGRGGAGFPTATKWRICAEQETNDRAIVCNADEGDPGAFIDRALLESDPHSLIEGMAIAAHAVGAVCGYIYVRAEYPLAIERVRHAIEQARERSILGQGVLGSGLSFDIEVFEAAGSFACGEETALLASMEGGRGTPVPRPPYPAQSGLDDLPTVIDNVKTFAYVRHIVEDGGEAFARIGMPESTGTAVFALSGKVARPGLIEVPMGTTLREAVFDVGGGMQDPNFEKPGTSAKDTLIFGERIWTPPARDYEFKAVQIGGPSGGCLPASCLDMPIAFDTLDKAGAMMGSGGLVVMADDDCMVDMARYFLGFTSSESCGKCTPCRAGSQCMLDVLTRISEGDGAEDDMRKLQQLAETMQHASLCNLGRTAPNPVLTTLRYFEDEYRRHIELHECPALVCRNLISYVFDDVRCPSACDECCIVCEAIVSDTGYDGLQGRVFRTHEIIDELCTRCGICVDSCAGRTFRAISKVTPALRKGE